MALSAWERLESVMAELFDGLVAEQPSNRAAFSAYIAIKTASARTELLKAAYKRALTLDDPAREPAGQLIHAFGKLGARRNEIAHGIVYHPEEHGFYLAPNNIMKHKWRAGAASYQYVANDLRHYVEAFQETDRKARSLVNELVVRDFEKQQERDRKIRAAACRG
jgi:hypothetical protein